MAVVNQILHRKNSSGSYDTVYLQSNLSNVTGVLAPEHGGTGASEITDVTPVEFTPYVHPAEKQCNYSYIHPSAKQCDAVIPDISNYYTKAEVDDMIIAGTWQVGFVIKFDNKDWLICHKDFNNNQVYLIARDIVDNTSFGNGGIYAGSTLAARCTTYQNESISAEALAKCVNVTVEGVTAKVFVPSFGQMGGGFSWFNSDDHRRASSTYWTSSLRDGQVVRAVTSNGDHDSFGVPAGNTAAFRPCICVQL